MDTAYYEDVAGKLRGLLIRLSDRLQRTDQILIAEFIDVNELGLALEQMADVLSEDEQPLSAEERSDMLAVAEQMDVGDRVSRALASCPN
ncbi:MafI family immunity protein [Actinopolymorpha alba]|uniref:MafI family immunity protein n=1 Tax=Actinopolymorpha alba TaxID=533267 RepID=UPI0003A014D8|nr:MafI family immunity protein [Actinopolymorpha alba]